jgi:hypothetical protein
MIKVGFIELLELGLSHNKDPSALESEDQNFKHGGGWWWWWWGGFEKCCIV